MREQGVYVQTGFAVNRAAVVLHRNHPRTGFGKQLASDAAHIAKALHRHPRRADVQPDMPGRFDADGEHAAPRGFASPQRAAQIDRLAGHHAR